MPPSKSAPEEPFLPPIAFVPSSNGEFSPLETNKRDHFAYALFRKLADERARKLGVDRRVFLRSSAANALALLVLDRLYGCSSPSAPNDATTDIPVNPDVSRDAGLFYDVNDAMTFDEARACERLSGNEFIFDVQTHHVDPLGAWRRRDRGFTFFLATQPQSSCGETDHVDCFNAEHYLREVFVRSDVSVACLSGVPAEPTSDPLDNMARLATKAIVDRIANSPRLVLHATVLPDRGESALAAMDQFADRPGVLAWKVYQSFGNWRFDDPRIGQPFLERARRLRRTIICTHRGISQDAGTYDDFSSPKDLGPAAAANPDLTFIAYHSGWETGDVEGPYNADNPRGIDRLIKTVETAGRERTRNLYAELGTTWRGVMNNPVAAAHLLGKLLKHLGEDNILWGSDCIWYGSPQEQLVAFRAFQIPPSMREQFGYPELTPAVKAKILGLNAARVYGVDVNAMRCRIIEDDLTRLRRDARADPLRDRPPGMHYGPRTRREFLQLLRTQRT